MNHLITNDRSSRIVAFICAVFGITVIVGAIIFLPGCSSAKMPEIDVKFWAADPAEDGITRYQDQKTMKCNDPEFDQYTCLTYEDVKKIFDAMLKCKDWSGKSVPHTQNPAFLKNQEIIEQKVLKRGE